MPWPDAGLFVYVRCAMLSVLKHDCHPGTECAPALEVVRKTHMWLMLAQDIGPRYSGVLLGMSNTAGVLAGVFGTAATGYILKNGSWDEVCVKTNNL